MHRRAPPAATCISCAIASSATTKTRATWRRTCSSARSAACRTFKGEASLGTWLYRIARERLAEQGRREDAEAGGARSAAARRATSGRRRATRAPSEALLRGERAAQVRAAIAQAAEEAARHADPAVYHELPHEQIAGHPRQLGRRREGELLSRAEQPEEADAHETTCLPSNSSTSPRARSTRRVPRTSSAATPCREQAARAAARRCGARRGSSTCPSRRRSSGITCRRGARRRSRRSRRPFGPAGAGLASGVRACRARVAVVVIAVGPWLMLRAHRAGRRARHARSRSRRRRAARPVRRSTLDDEHAEVWAVLTAAAADLEFDEAHAAGMAVQPAAVDRAVQADRGRADRARTPAAVGAETLDRMSVDGGRRMNDANHDLAGRTILFVGGVSVSRRAVAAAAAAAGPAASGPGGPAGSGPRSQRRSDSALVRGLHRAAGAGRAAAVRGAVRPVRHAPEGAAGGAAAAPAGAATRSSAICGG